MVIIYLVVSPVLSAEGFYRFYREGGRLLISDINLSVSYRETDFRFNITSRRVCVCLCGASPFGFFFVLQYLFSVEQFTNIFIHI